MKEITFEKPPLLYSDSLKDKLNLESKTTKLGLFGQIIFQDLHEYENNFNVEIYKLEYSNEQIKLSFNIHNNELLNYMINNEIKQIKLFDMSDNELKNILLSKHIKKIYEKFDDNLIFTIIADYMHKI